MSYILSYLKNPTPFQHRYLNNPLPRHRGSSCRENGSNKVRDSLATGERVYASIASQGFGKTGSRVSRVHNVSSHSEARRSSFQLCGPFRVAASQSPSGKKTPKLADPQQVANYSAASEKEKRRPMSVPPRDFRKRNIRSSANRCLRLGYVGCFGPLQITQLSLTSLPRAITFIILFLIPTSSFFFSFIRAFFISVLSFVLSSSTSSTTDRRFQCEAFKETPRFLARRCSGLGFKREKCKSIRFFRPL